MAKIHFLKQNRSFEVPTGMEFTQLCKIDPSIPLKFGCQKGECGVCLIKVVDGIEKISKRTKQERATLQKLNKASEDVRLACQCALLGDITIDS